MKKTTLFISLEKRKRRLPRPEGAFLYYTKGMGEMFTLKQRGVCLYVIYFTRLSYHGIIVKSIFHKDFHKFVILIRRLLFLHIILLFHDHIKNETAEEAISFFRMLWSY